MIIGLLIGGDPQKLISDFQQSSQQTQTTTGTGTPEVEESAEEKAMSSFMKVTLADNERIWDSIFTANQMQYQKPVLVLFRNLTNSPCGDATSQSGPFYCPGDQKNLYRYVFLR